MEYLREEIIKNIKKYIQKNVCTNSKKTNLNILQKEVLYNIIKYNPFSIIGYLINFANQPDYKKLYYYLFKEPKINAPFIYPGKYDNLYRDAIYYKLTKPLTIVMGIRNVVKHYYGFLHNILLLNTGEIASYGHNDLGQLGLGDWKNRETPIKVEGITDVSRVYCGDDHSVLLLKNGEIMTCGNNYFGELGLNDNKNRNIFEKVQCIRKVVQVSCGMRHTVILLKTGIVMGCGSNENGRLGFSQSKKKLKRFKIIKELEQYFGNIKQIECGNAHTVILLKNGTIVACGNNKYGQLGFGNEDDKYFFGKMNNVKNVSKISCGNWHTRILLKNGEEIIKGERFDRMCNKNKKRGKSTCGGLIII